MCFSFCLNKNELLLLAGFGLLYQGLDLDRKGKLIQDSQRLMCSVIEILDHHAAPGATEFKKVACAMMSVGRFSKSARALDEGPASRRKSDSSMPAPEITSKSTRKQLQAIASRFTADAPSQMMKKEDNISGRRATLPNVPNHIPAPYTRSESQNSVSSIVSDPTHRHGHNRGSSNTTPPSQDGPRETPNLDYLSFNDEPKQSSKFCNKVFKDSEPDLSTGFNPIQQLDAPYSSLYPSPDVISTYISTSASAQYDWSSDLLTMAPNTNSHPTSNSVLSYSEEEFTSGEELSTCDLPIDYRGIAIPDVDRFAEIDGLDSNFTL